jgi:hypothetical protein
MVGINAFSHLFLQTYNDRRMRLSGALRRNPSRAFLLSYCISWELSPEAPEQDGCADAKNASVARKMMVNLQTLITTHHGLSLVVSSRFRRRLFSRFAFFSEISGKWVRINRLNLTTFSDDSRPRRHSRLKTPLVERVCRAFSGAVSYAFFPASPTGPTKPRQKNALAAFARLAFAANSAGRNLPPAPEQEERLSRSRARLRSAVRSSRDNA